MRVALILSLIGSLVSLQLLTSMIHGPAFAQHAYAQTASNGAPFTFVDEDGVERAVITVIEVQDPFDDVAEGYVPAEGSRVVMITVSFENIGTNPFETRPDLIVLQDTDGYLWSSTGVQRPDDIEVPDLRNVEMAPGDRISGMVGFLVPIDAGVAGILLRPESSRLLSLGSVDADPALGPEPGSEVAYQIPDEMSDGLISVTEIEDPFDDFPEGREPQDGARYVLVTITVENTGSAPLSIGPSDMLIQDGDGYLWSYASVPRGDDIAIPDLQSQELAPGSRISGVVGFQIPMDSVVSSILLQPENGRIIALAQLDAGGNDGATPEPKLGTVDGQ